MRNPLARWDIGATGSPFPGLVSPSVIVECLREVMDAKETQALDGTPFLLLGDVFLNDVQHAKRFGVVTTRAIHVSDNTQKEALLQLLGEGLGGLAVVHDSVILVLTGKKHRLLFSFQPLNFVDVLQALKDQPSWKRWGEVSKIWVSFHNSSFVMNVTCKYFIVVCLFNQKKVESLFFFSWN